MRNFKLIAALAALAFGASLIGPALTAGAVGFIAFGGAIALVGVGAILAASALAAKAVDEIEFHYAPKILGGAGSRTVCDGVNPETLSEAIPVENMKISRCGRDFIVSGKPVY